VTGNSNSIIALQTHEVAGAIVFWLDDTVDALTPDADEQTLASHEVRGALYSTFEFCLSPCTVIDDSIPVIESWLEQPSSATLNQFYMLEIFLKIVQQHSTAPAY
jgi:hypothetical protein